MVIWSRVEVVLLVRVLRELLRTYTWKSE